MNCEAVEVMKNSYKFKHGPTQGPTLFINSLEAKARSPQSPSLITLNRTLSGLVKSIILYSDQFWLLFCWDSMTDCVVPWRTPRPPDSDDWVSDWALLCLPFTYAASAAAWRIAYNFHALCVCHIIAPAVCVPLIIDWLRPAKPHGIQSWSFIWLIESLPPSLLKH